MYYQVESNKSFDQAVTDLEASVKEHGLEFYIFMTLEELYAVKG